MLKSKIKVVALLLVLSSVLALSGCSDNFEAKWESFWEKRQDTTTTEGISESRTPIPVEATEIVNYFNGLIANVKTINPGFNWESTRDVSDAQSSNKLLKAAVPTVKNYMLKSEKKEKTFGEPLTDFFQLAGNPVLSTDVLSATCEQIEDTYEILITFKDEAVQNTAAITSRYFELESKAEVLAEFQKAKDYLIVSDYDEFFTGSTIKCVVNRLDDRILNVTYTKSAKITTQVTGAGELTEIGEVDLSFVLKNDITYKDFVYDDPDTTTQAE